MTLAKYVLNIFVVQHLNCYMWELNRNTNTNKVSEICNLIWALSLVFIRLLADLISHLTLSCLGGGVVQHAEFA